MQLTFAASEIVVTKIIIPILTYGTVPLFHVTFTGTLTKEILKKKKKRFIMMKFLCFLTISYYLESFTLTRVIIPIFRKRNFG